MTLFTRPSMLQKLPPHQRVGLLRELFSFFVILLAGSAPQLLLLLLSAFFFPDISASNQLLISLYSTAFMILSVCRLGKRLRNRTASKPELAPLHWLKDHLFGSIVGVLMLLAAALVCIFTNSIGISPSASLPIGTWLLFLPGFLIQGASEELFCRGYLFPILAERYSLGTATVLNALVFALLHTGNNGVSLLALCNVFLFGVLASLCVIRRGSIWLACGMHSLWNFAQGNLLGISVSGSPTLPSPLTSVFSETRTLWNGGDFGLEGGLAVTIVLLLAIFVILFCAARVKRIDTK